MVSNPALATFLVNAKCRTYAGGGRGADTSPLLPGSRQLEYREEDLLYRDVYFGAAFFVGQEMVYEGSTPVWAMSYAGGVIPGSRLATIELYKFLRAALRRVNADRPYRGPSQWREGRLTYADESEGDIRRFQGTEVITCEGEPVQYIDCNTAVACCSERYSPWGKKRLHLMRARKDRGQGDAHGSREGGRTEGS